MNKYNDNVKPFGYWSIKENCLKECEKYTAMTELKHKSSGCYASVLKHGWEDGCFPNYKKRMPNGFWNIKEHCIKEAVKYRNLREFQSKCYTAYRSCKINGWIDEVNKLYNKTVIYHSYEDRIHCVYVYEIIETKSCYIGRSNNVARRHRQHINDNNDTLHKYCIENDVNIPRFIILKDRLNAIESQYYEDYYLKEYKNNGWNVLNKAVTGVDKGSLGASCKWNYETCKNEAAKYSTIVEFEKRSQSAYNACKKNGWTYDFFKVRKLNNGYWNDYENCKKAFMECNSVKELVQKYGGCYNSIRRNNFTDLKYEKGKRNR